MTVNNNGNIVSGSQVRLSDNIQGQIYDVGEVYGDRVYLYQYGKLVVATTIDKVFPI